MQDVVLIGAGLIAALLLLLVRTRRRRPLVDPALLRYVMESSDPDPKSEATSRTLEITAVFTNLNDFAPVFSRLGDAGGARLLSEYLAAMTPIARRHRGFLNRFAFDQIFILYGAPVAGNPADHATDALQTVIDMQAEMVRLNGLLASRGLPALSMRAGIATGEAYVGDIGGVAHVEYTAIGPAVNLALRLERACKPAGVPNLVSIRTRALAGPAFRYRAVTAAAAVDPDEAMEVIGRDGEAQS